VSPAEDEPKPNDAMTPFVTLTCACAEDVEKAINPAVMNATNRTRAEDSANALREVHAMHPREHETREKHGDEARHGLRSVGRA